MIKTPAGKGPKMVELNDTGKTLSYQKTAADVGSFPEEHRWLVYRAEAPRPSSIDSFFEKKVSLSSIEETKRQCGKVLREPENEAGDGTGQGF